MAGKPYQSILIPYQNEIIALRRRKPPTPYSQIVKLLREKYKITITDDGIRYFIRNRAQKGFKNKTCKYAWNIELLNPNNQPTTETPFTQKQTVLRKPDITPTPVSDIPKPRVKTKDKPSVSDESEPVVIPEFEFPFTEINTLRPLPPEEARALRKKYGLE